MKDSLSFFDDFFSKNLDKIIQVMHKIFVVLLSLTFLIIKKPISLYKLTFFSFSALGPLLLLEYSAY